MVYDVAIVGAGPAGSICSFFLAKAGLKTLLLEKEKIPRYKPCGGSISWRIINELPYNVKKVLEEKIRKVEFYSPTMENKAEYKYAEPIGHTTDRERFDALLAERAEDVGVELLEDCTFKSLSIKKDFVELETSKGNFKSKFLVGADGTHSLVAKKARIREKWIADQLAFLVVSHFKSGEHDKETAKFYFGPNKAFNVGYGWIFPLSHSLNVGFGARLVEAQGLEKKFQEFVRKNKELKNLKLERFHSTTMPYQDAYLEKPYAKKIVLIGDAAGFVNLISGEGVFHAIMSGKIAAKNIIEAIENEDMSGEANFKKYVTEYLGLFGDEFGELALKMQRQLYKDHQTQELFVKMMSCDEKLAKHIIELLYAVENFGEKSRKINRRIIISYLKTILNRG